ncbi:MAG: THUMP domain-containing protein [Nanoarchaeota archaeon]|nr:THUMP domain-containing protein [Nanoarchaeota archaeon]
MAVIVKYGEIAIKGQNRKEFVKKLIRNIKDCLKKNNIDFDSIVSFRGRIIVNTENKCPCLKYVYGIANFSYSNKIETSLDAIKIETLKHYKKGTFRISAKRIDKAFIPSDEINREVGSYIIEKTGAKVNLSKPETTIWIDVFKDRCYIYSSKIQGLKGLPVGIEGTVAVLLEDKDSVKAAKLIMKRGCGIVLIQIAGVDWSALKKLAYGFKIKVLKEIPHYIKVVVTSEKLKNFKKRDIDKVVLRPLIAF